MPTSAAQSPQENEVVSHYIDKAGGDVGAAMLLMAKEVIFQVGEIEFLERDVTKANARADRYQAVHEAEVGNWFDKLWRSEAAKTIVFILGVLTGVYASK